MSQELRSDSDVNWSFLRANDQDTQSELEEMRSDSGSLLSSHTETRSDPGRTLSKREAKQSCRETQSDPGQPLPDFEDVSSESDGSQSPNAQRTSFRTFITHIGKAAELDWHANAYSEDAQAIRKEIEAKEMLVADVEAKAEKLRKFAIAQRRAATEDFEESLGEDREMKTFKVLRRGGQSRFVER